MFLKEVTYVHQGSIYLYLKKKYSDNCYIMKYYYNLK